MSSSASGGGAGGGGGGRDRASQRESIKSGRAGADSIQTLKRAQVFAELSKARRAENFNKRRRGHEAETQGAAGKGDSSMAAGAPAAAAAAPVAMSEAEVQALLSSFRAAYVPAGPPGGTAVIPAAEVAPAERARLLRQMRLLLSNDDAPVAAVVAAGAIPCLIAELGAQVASSAAPSAATPLPEGGAASSQLDAIWCLTNIASDTTAHTRAVLPAAPALISFLSGANTRIQEQCVWCLGNLASEEQECRRQLLDNGILLPLIRLLQLGCPSAIPPLPLPVPAPSDPAQLALVRVVSWALSNLIKTSRSAAKVAAGAGASQDDVQRHLAAFAAAAPSLVPTLFALLRSADEQLAQEATWVLAAWAHHGEAVLQSLVQNGLLPALLARMYLLRLTPLAQGPSVQLDAQTGLPRDPLAGALIPLVRVLGNLANGADALIQALLSTEVPNPSAAAAASAAGAPTPSALPAPPNAFVLVFSTLERSLSSVHRGLKKETCWVLANLAASGVAQVHDALVLNERGEPGVFVQGLFQTMRQAQFDVKREAGHCLYNLARCRDGHYLPVLFPRVPLASADPIAASSSPTVLLLREFCNFLRSRDAEAILIALRVVELLLRVHPDGVRIVEENQGIDALEAVQQHCEQAQLVDYAHRLVDAFFGAGEGDDDEEEDLAQDAPQQNEELPPWRVQHTPPRPAAAGGANAAAAAAPANALPTMQNEQVGPPPGGFQF